MRVFPLARRFGLLSLLCLGAACSHRESRQRALTPTEAVRRDPSPSIPIAPAVPSKAPIAEHSSANVHIGQLPHPDFQWPVENVTVINYYGWRGKRRIHEGVDLRAPTGTRLYAAAKGTVIHAARGIRGYGRLIVIDHGNEWSTVYGHLSKFAVKAGEKVQAGELIGYSGRTGRARGPHLHFEIRKDADPLDPLIFLGSD